MPQCEITAGFAATACQLPSKGTSFDQIWLFNLSEYGSYTEAAGVVSAFSMNTAKVAYKIEIKKGSGILAQEKQEDDNGGIDYMQSFSFTISDVSSTAQQFVDSLNGGRFTVVVLRNDQTFDVVGLDEGIELTTMTESTDGVLGYQCMLSGDGFNYVTKKFLDTDLATSITTLDGYT